MRFTFDWLRRRFRPHPDPALRARQLRRWARLASGLIFATAVAAAAVSRHVPKAQGSVLPAVEFVPMPFASGLIFASAAAAAEINRHCSKVQDDVLLALEFTPSAQEIREKVPECARARILRAQRDDTWLLVPAYWALFSASGLVLRLSGGRVNRTTGAVVMASITLAAIFDLRENQIINTALESSAAAANPVPWARAKWLLLFTSSLALSVPLLTRARRRLVHANLTAALAAASALLGGWATLVDHTQIPAAMLPMAVALFLLALLFLWDPEFCSKPF